MAEISVAIYVQNYVPHLLERTVRSVLTQSVESLEVIVTEDCRTGSESKCVRTLFKKITKSMNISYGKSIRILSMGQSVGMADSLRAAAQDSSGLYFTILMMGDAFQNDDSLGTLLLAARENDCGNEDWHLIQGCVVPERKKIEIIEKNPSAYDIIEKNVAESIVCQTADEFCEKYFLPENHSLCLEGKLFLRSVLVESLEKMPRVRCYCGTEYLWAYYFCRKCTRMVSIDGTVCVKDMDVLPDEGDYIIETPSRWAKICSSASVFSAIFFDLMDNPTESVPVVEYFRSAMSRFAISNVRCLERVHESISTVALAMLEEYWGQDIISRCREWLYKSKNIDTF